ncbi:16S rRNA (guanine1207-N2)-methyltransferase [Agromyces hippuratus]|uniref:16S rRNA (Guanine1207-N2)-methyltransferase n=1 Tax=Agromyces hippuratus TaxID=286438 RepID=A0A852X0B7_9MICO|nr:class I SAM-dependent methyltransferase [Agromyces hippuratus]NYG21603.1 16S rRNA (guanine1207-N2)-methyltransferase [Agromyces hippuratus]
MPIDLDALRRHPDVEGPGLEASDAADRLILDEAAALIGEAGPGEIVVVDDSYGALALAAADAGARGIRVHQDLVTGERALAGNAGRLGLEGEVRSLPLDSELVAGARLVLMRLPRSLDRLDEVSQLITAHAHPAVVVVAGGRIKHMSLAMNDVLGRSFGRVDVSRARQKSRVLFARDPAGAPRASADAAWPRSTRHDDLALTVVAHGGVFAGTGVDIGTRFLLAQLGGAVPDAASAVDLACGTGVVASWLARARPALRVTATDRSASAAASARLTAEANGVADRVHVTRADGLEGLADASERLIVLNPPFHSDAAISTGIAAHLFADAARVLAPGGELWCVWNSHLAYRPLLERVVGRTRQVARNPKFTVTASQRAAA